MLTQKMDAATEQIVAHSMMGCFLLVESLHDPQMGKMSKTGTARIMLFHTMNDAANF